MIYLLTLGWPWFAGALALGALIGFLTFRPATEASVSGGWVIVAGALALAAAGAVSAMELLAGRAAATFDISLLAGLAYAAGLPVGGFARSLGGGEAEKKRAAIAPIVVTPARVAAPEPIIEPQTVALDAAPVEVKSAEAALVVAESVAPAPRTKKTAGVKPETLAAPRDGAPDDLSRIKGIGPKSLEKLHALGVFHYDQIAVWNLDNARWVGAAIGAPGRVERDKWIQQARKLTGAGTEQ